MTSNGPVWPSTVTRGQRSVVGLAASVVRRRCSPGNRSSESVKIWVATSNCQTGVIGLAMKECPAPEGNRRRTGPAGSGRRHRSEWRWATRHWPPHTSHVVEECWAGDTPSLILVTDAWFAAAKARRIGSMSSTLLVEVMSTVISAAGHDSSMRSLVGAWHGGAALVPQEVADK